MSVDRRKETFLQNLEMAKNSKIEFQVEMVRLLNKKKNLPRIIKLDLGLSEIENLVGTSADFESRINDSQEMTGKRWSLWIQVY